MNPLLATWAVVVAFWPFGAAFVVAAVAWCVDTGHDATWDRPNTLPGNLSEGRQR